MEPRLAVEVALRGGNRCGQLVVEEAAAVLEPAGLRLFGVGDALGQVGAVGHVEHVQDRVLAAIAGDAVDHALAVRGGLPPVQRLVGRSAAAGRRVDEHPVDAALRDEQLEVVGTGRALLEEQPAAGALHRAGDGRVTGELLDALQQRGAPRDQVEHRARVRILSLEERQPVGVLGILHPAVRIAHGLAEVGVLHHRDARHGRGGNGRCAQRRLTHQEARADAARAHEQVPTIDAAHRLAPEMPGLPGGGLWASARAAAQHRCAGHARAGAGRS